MRQRTAQRAPRPRVAYPPTRRVARRTARTEVDRYSHPPPRERQGSDLGDLCGVDSKAGSELPSISKSDTVFRAVYHQLLTTMPYLRGSDVVDEMLSRCVYLLLSRACLPDVRHHCTWFLRMSDKPSRRHICESFRFFVKTEIRKDQSRLEKRRRKEINRGKGAVKPEQASSSAQVTRAANSTCQEHLHRM